MALQWLTLVVTIWLQTINGSNSNFPAYSSELKKILNISQLQLNNLASASDAGKLLGWVSGIAAQYLPLWLVLLIGSCLGLIGYGVQFLFLTDKIHNLSYWEVFALTVLAGNSICWINTVCYVLVINNFPLDRQIAIGLSTSYVGLSAKIYTDLVDVFKSQRDNNDLSADAVSHERAKLFLLLNSVVPLLVCIATSFLARDIEVKKTRKLSEGFFSLFVITLLTGVFAVITSMGSTGSKFLPDSVVLVGTLVFLMLPLVVPAGEKMSERLEQKCRIRIHDEGFSSTIEIASKEDGHNNHQKESCRCNDSEKCDHHHVSDHDSDIGPMMMLRKVEFWLYFFVYFFGATIGLVYLNNLGQIAESRGCSGISSLVALSSACSFFGRLMPSMADYFFSKAKYVSRGAAMGSMMIPMSGAFFLLTIISHNSSLYITAAIIGTCTGAITSISVSTTNELFGTNNFGVNHNILVSNIPIGSFLFGDFAAFLYKREGINNHNNSYDGNNNNYNCMGTKCYETTFIVWGFLCGFGTLLAFVLHARTKHLYMSNNKLVQKQDSTV